MKISPDQIYLISASSDGSIFLSKIREFQDGHDISALDLTMALGAKAKEFNFAKIPNVFSLNSLSLTSKSGNDLKKDLIKELEFRI